MAAHAERFYLYGAATARRVGINLQQPADIPLTSITKGREQPISIRIGPLNGDLLLALVSSFQGGRQRQQSCLPAKKEWGNGKKIEGARESVRGKRGEGAWPHLDRPSDEVRALVDNIKASREPLNPGEQQTNLLLKPRLGKRQHSGIADGGEALVIKGPRATTSEDVPCAVNG